jgi:hypothetical protein
MGNVFTVVKENISTADAAEMYGIKVSRNGMACCPFHEDKHPSMKIDSRYHCFGCQADGDVIDFVANLFELGLKEAAIKIAGDFGLQYDNQTPNNGPPIYKKKTNQYREYKIAENHFWQVITDYYRLLLFWEKQYSPTTPDQDWDERFVEAVMNINVLDYVMDVFLESDRETRAEIIKDYGRKITEYERRINYEKNCRRSTTAS